MSLESQRIFGGMTWKPSSCVKPDMLVIIAPQWPTEMEGVDLATENEIGVVWGSKDLAKFLESRRGKKKKKHLCARDNRGL